MLERFRQRFCRRFTRIADLGFVGPPEEQHLGGFSGKTGFPQDIDKHLGYVIGHGAIDGARSGDEASGHAHIRRTLNHVVRVDGNAVAAHANAGGVTMEIPFRRCSRQHVFHVHVHGGEDTCKFVDQGDVDVALHVLDDLGCLGDLELPDVAYVLTRELTVQLNQRFTHLGIGAADDPRHGTNAVSSIAGVEPLGAVGDFNVLTDGHPQLVNQGEPGVSRHTGIDRGLQHHDGVGTFWNRFKHRLPSRLDVRQVRLEVVRHGCRNGHEDDVAMGNRLSGGGCDVPAFGTGPRDDVVHVRVARRVVAGLDHVNGALRDVHAPYGKPSIVETNGGRKPNIAQADDADGHVGI